jgi:hypothetical protein
MCMRHPSVHHNLKSLGVQILRPGFDMLALDFNKLRAECPRTMPIAGAPLSTIAFHSYTGSTTQDMTIQVKTPTNITLTLRRVHFVVGPWVVELDVQSFHYDKICMCLCPELNPSSRCLTSVTFTRSYCIVANNL